MGLEKHYIITENKQYQLPVPPDSWEITSGQNIGTVNLLNFGEIITGTTPTLRTWSISKYFPHDNYGFISDGEMLKPYEYVELIENLKKNGTQITYMITETNVNIPCIITNFIYSEQDYTGDVYYQIDFKEDKTIGFNNNTVKGYVPESNSGNYFWTVKEGDTILSICQKAYGDSSKYSQLLSKNGLKNPSQIKVGVTLQL